MTIQSKNPRNNVVIDAQGLGYIFNISPNNKVTLRNITLINGAYNMGGAIFNKESLTLINYVFKDNRAFTEGGTIYTNSTTEFNIINCTFDNNSVPTNIGGAISNVNVSNMYMYIVYLLTIKQFLLGNSN